MRSIARSIRLITCAMFEVTEPHESRQDGNNRGQQGDGDRHRVHERALYHYSGSRSEGSIQVSLTRSPGSSRSLTAAMASAFGFGLRCEFAPFGRVEVPALGHGLTICGGDFCPCPDPSGVNPGQGPRDRQAAAPGRGT